MSKYKIEVTGSDVTEYVLIFDFAVKSEMALKEQLMLRVNYREPVSPRNEMGNASI